MKLLITAFLSLFCVSAGFAQSTTVSGQVTDSGSQSWNNGTITFSFVPAVNQNIQPSVWSGGAFNPGSNISSALNATGAYSVSIPSNTSITPSGSSWTISVCAGTLPSPCFYKTGQLITGGTQTINLTPPAISLIAGPGVTAYSTGEITSASLGSQFYLIGTGLQVCSAVSGNSCTTWGSPGSSVPSFATVVDAKSQGVLASSQLVWDAAFTSGSNVVSIPNGDMNLANVQLGWIAFGTNPQTNIEAAGSVVVPQGFVCGVNVGSKTVTVGTTFPACAADNATANCTFNSPANQGCVFVVGPDDTAALQTAWNTTVNAAPCSALALPIGIMLTQKGQFNTQPTNLGPCRTGAGNAWQGAGIFGVGSSFVASMIVPTPSFDFTNGSGNSCGGGVDTHSCFLGSHSMYATNFAIFGAGNAGSGCSATAAADVGVEFDGSSAAADAYGLNLAFTGWMSKCTNSGTSSFIGLKATSASMVGLSNVWDTGFGFVSCQFDPIAQGYISMYSGACAGGTGSATGFAGSTAAPSGLWITGTGSPGGYVVSYGAIYGNGQGSSQSAIHFKAGTTTRFVSYGDQISNTLSSQNNVNDILIPAATSSARADLFGSQLFNGGGNTGGISSGLNISSGSVHLHGANLSCTGTACSTIATASGANIFDDCANTLSSVGTAFIGSGNLFGSCSITGTASATGNWGLTSGWGTSSVASAVGDSHRTKVSITGAAGSAGPVLTWTFPTAFLVAPSSCSINQVGGTFGTLTNAVVGTPTATSVTFTFTGTPASATYTFEAQCGP